MSTSQGLVRAEHVCQQLSLSRPQWVDRLRRNRVELYEHPSHR